MAMQNGKEPEKNPWPERLGLWQKFSEKFHQRGTMIEARYEDDRDTEYAAKPSMLGDAGIKKVNMFFSNTTVLKESLYNSLPKPDVSRLHKGDYDDEPSRVAASIMQRGLTYEIHCAEYFDVAIKAAILDRLVPGLGCTWVTFVGPTENSPEKINVEIVYWKDLLYEPNRMWELVGWVGRIIHMDRSKAKKRWPNKNFDEPSQLTKGSYNAPTNSQADTVNEGKVCIIQMWDRTTREVLHLTAAGGVLDRMSDPYKLKGFYPCPKPLVASPPTKKFLPLPDFYIAQDQYMELDIIYARINLIIEAVKVAGVYDAASPEIGRMLSGAENRLIPVDNWAMFADKGGAKGVISWYPVETITQVLTTLVSTYEFIKTQLFEVTGMADIVRGSTNQYETAAAQQIKAKFASVRMNGFQRDTAEFVRSTVRIIGEMMTQLYSDEKLSKVCGKLPDADQEFVPQALQILRDDFLTKYAIDIETDSLTQADWGLEQQQRMTYVQALATFIQGAMPMAQENPSLAPLMIQVIKFASVGFKGASELEGTIDKALQAMEQLASQPKQEKPDPAVAKAQAEVQVMQQKAQVEMEMRQQKMQQDAAEHAQQMQFDREKQQLEIQFMREKAMLENQQAAAKADLDAQIATQKAVQGAQQSNEQFVQSQMLEGAAAKIQMKRDEKKED